MAKSRADGTPGKAAGKKKATTPSPAKKTKAKAKSESPERRIARSSPRRATLSTKAQEAAAAAEKVQAGRVVKKTSPKKATSPAKAKAQTLAAKKNAAASPAKETAQTPPEGENASPTCGRKGRKILPQGVLRPPLGPSDKTYGPDDEVDKTIATQPPRTQYVLYGKPRATVSRILAPPPKQQGSFAVADPPSDRSKGTRIYRNHEEYVPTAHCRSRSKTVSLSCANVDILSIEKARIDNIEKDLTNWAESMFKNRTVREISLTRGLSMLKGAVTALGEHDAIGLPLDDPQTRSLRSICRDVWMTLRGTLGTAIDDYLDKDIPDGVFLRALLRVQGAQANGSSKKFDTMRVWDLYSVVPLEYKDVVDLFGNYKRENQIDKSPPRSPPRSGSEEQQGWWDYWEEHPESGEKPLNCSGCSKHSTDTQLEDENFPFIFSRAAARDAGQLVIPAKRMVGEILAGPPKGKLPAGIADKQGRISLQEEYVTIPRKHPERRSTIPESLLVFEVLLTMGFRSRYKQLVDADTEEMIHWLEHELEAPQLEERHFTHSYHLLAEGVNTVKEHDANGINNAQVRRLRPVCQELWNILRDLVGSALDECLEQEVPSHIFTAALVRAQGPAKKFRSEEDKSYRYGWDAKEIVPFDYDFDVADLFKEWKREPVPENGRGCIPDPSPGPASPAKQAQSKPEFDPVEQYNREGRVVAAATKRTRSKSPAPAPASPAKRSQSKSPTKRTASSRKSSVSSNASSTIPGYVHQNVRGNIISPTNLPTVAELNQTNRFHETLPAPEVWHRRMPPYFTFGETPYMQKLASDQIQHDLNRSELL